MNIFKKILSILLRISISITLLFFLFRQIDRKALLEIVKNSDKGLLFVAFLIFFSSHILGLFRWEMLLKVTEIHLTLKRIIISFSGGVFFSLILPSTIGGDLVRSIDLAAHTRRPREIVATVLLDRLSGYVGLVVLALLAALVGYKLIQDESVIISLAIITGILISILLVLFNKTIYSKVNKLLHSPHSYGQGQGESTVDRIREAIKNLHQEMHYFKDHKKVILNNLILSLLIQMSSPMSFFIIALSLGIKINVIYFFIFSPIINAITLLPISIGGLGLRDATTVFFFAKAGVLSNLAFAMSLLTFFFMLICASLGGLIYVFTVHHRRIQYHKPPTI